VIFHQDGGVGFEDEEESEEEEGRRPVVKRSPHQPTNEEIREHNVSHVPYRNWCPVCVQGRGKEDHHKKAKEEEERGVPTAHVDYWFMRDHKGAELIPVATLKLDVKKVHKAHVVPFKGNVEGVAREIVRDLDEMGISGELIIKNDQEPALIDLVKEVKRLRTGGTQLEKSKKYDSQSNGAAERAVQSVEGITRTLKLALEKRLGCEIPCAHPVMAWLVKHGAECLNRYLVGKDGRTAYERLKGKRYKGDVCEFGQMVMHKFPGKQQGGVMKTRWGEGVWLGKMAASDENIVATNEGIMKMRTVTRIPERESWCKEKVMAIKTTPWKLSIGDKGEDDEAEVVRPYEAARMADMEERPAVDVPEPQVHESAPHGVYIRPEELRDYGYTDACQKCRAMKRGDMSLSGRSHSKECKERIRKAMAENDKHKEKVQAADDRKNEFLARQVEKFEEDTVDAKRTRVSFEGQGSSSSSSGRGGEIPQAGAEPIDVRAGKRRRDPQHDEEDQDRPTAYQATEQDDDEDMEKNTRKRKLDFEPEDMVGMISMKEGKFDVVEIFSPPRVSERARSRGMNGGWSLDWMTKCPMTGQSWDLRREHVQRKAMALLKRDKPGLLVACPPCTLFSNLQRLGGDSSRKDEEKWKDAIEMVEFSVRMCREQMRGGRKFVFEHPLCATSWKLECLRDLRDEAGVHQVTAHQCAYGLVSQDAHGVAAAMKPTRFLTNGGAIAEKLQRRCSRDHRHVQLLGGRAAAAAKYPEELVDAILDGYQIERCSSIFTLEDAMTAVNVESLHEEMGVDWKYIDDVSGDELDAKMVRKARQEEMETFKIMNVYVHVSREEVRKSKSGKTIGVRWVDTKKADGRHRSRLVAQEFAQLGDRDDLFAATPPLAATKFILSELASHGQGGPGIERIMILDIKRAFLYGDLEEEVYIELPEEDPGKSQGLVGKLVKAMYGTRSAPQVWQEVVRKVMNNLGFKTSVKFPCVYFNRQRGLKVVTHVDDFLCTGNPAHLNWMLKELKKEFELTSAVMGPSDVEVQEATFLGRRIRWTRDGIEYEGDERHTKILLQEWDMKEAKATNTPGVTEVKKAEDDIQEDVILSKEDAKNYRRAAARINYMAQDRVDLGFAAKEVSRCMSSPCEKDVVKLKRVIRYLKGFPRLINVYKWQERPRGFEIYSDSDWAGCTKTRKSTSGGVLMSGSHIIHHWSSTQATTALSSAEAELNALVKAGCEAVGMVDLARDLGEHREGVLLTDSSAANGILHRRGCGKLKHLEARQLWSQELVMNKKLISRKVARELNPSDTLTHYWTINEGRQHFPRLGVEGRDMRADTT